MPHDLQQTISLLSHTPATLNALLRNQPEIWTLRDEGPGTWSAFDVVGHLIHCEQADWITRATTILQFGEDQAFEPLNRQTRAGQGQSLDHLLDEFTHLRKRNLDELRELNLQPSDLNRRGRHPAFGPVTLSQLLAAWAVHDLTHLHQIARTMAHQYRDAVGPWSAYLGVLQCNGHSAPP